MFKLEYKLLLKSVTQMFSKNREIHLHHIGNAKKILSESTGKLKNVIYLSARI